MTMQHSALMASLSSLHLNGKYSDLTVQCGQRHWSVHRAILCSRSTFFDGCCSGQFLEGQTGIIDLSDDDEEAVASMIEYFYHLDYLSENGTSSSHFDSSLSPPSGQGWLKRGRTRVRKVDPESDPLLALAATCGPVLPQAPLTPALTPSPSHRDDPIKFCLPLVMPPSPEEPEAVMTGYFVEAPAADAQLLMHTRVYALAEKYDIQALKDLACHKFEAAMACHFDSPDFADAIEEVYNSTIDTDRGLRNVVIQAFRSHPRIANTADVFEVIKRTPTLAFELWKTERGLPL